MSTKRYQKTLNYISTTRAECESPYPPPQPLPAEKSDQKLDREVEVEGVKYEVRYRTELTRPIGSPPIKTIMIPLPKESRPSTPTAVPISSSTTVMSYKKVLFVLKIVSF